MSYLYVPGLEQPISGSDLPWVGDIELSCTSSAKPEMRPSSWSGWKTRPWIARLSGTISQPLAAEAFAARWIWSVRASRANPIPLPERAPQTLTNGLSGLASREWYARANLRSSSLRTFQDSKSTPKGSSTRWKSWVSSGLRRSFKTPTHSGRLTDENACSFSLPTPSASAYGSNQGGASGRQGQHTRPSLDSMITRLPSPKARDAEAGVDPRTRAEGPNLITAIARLPSPTAGDAKASGAAGYSTESGRHSGTTLTDATCVAASAGRRGRLNPRFSEWMMGLPLGWTELRDPSAPRGSEPSETWVPRR